LIGEGATDEEIKTFLSSRYGEFVLYRPPVTPTTFVVWAAPFALLLLGAFVFFRILAARSTQPLDEELPP
jgi:cytochrome c-type biogenesis protein CcmH